MDETQRAYYSAIFDAEFLKRNGNEFEDLFTSIMTKRHPSDFVATIPWGSEGDWKCDGFLCSERVLYAAYAPREMSKSKATTKVENDFLGAIDKWGAKIDGWTLVHNSREGLPPFLVDLILDFGEHNNINIDKMGYEELKDTLFILSEKDIIDVLNLNSKAPTDTTEVRFQEIQKVVDTITGKRPDESKDPKEVSPDKIEANQLSSDVKHLLSVGRKKSYQVGSFFRSYHDPSYGDRIAKTVSDKYSELRDKGLSPDQIFHELSLFMGGETRKSAEHEMSVLAVLSYFFEQCDIFEPVNR